MFDIVLTNKGRQLLSKNQLKFVYYAFSDEEINYSGSLSSSAALSTSLDDVVRRNVSFEADQRKDKDLQTFIFTIPSRTKVLPEFVATISGTVNLNKTYSAGKLADISTVKGIEALQGSVAVIVHGTMSDLRAMENRKELYILEQKRDLALEKLKRGKNVVGDSLSAEHVIVDKNVVLNTTTGTVQTIKGALNSIHHNKVLSTDENLEIVKGLDKQLVELTLKNAEGEIFVNDGFLIEVFLSGTDGKLTKVYKEDINEGTGVMEYGFDTYLNLEIDVY